ncbi:MAG: tail fiber domain-containing protein, partial [Candidatus Delongbacteria bacterium]|nr:tail fiber domain-containing protein [Candidatus Delongbacteria bacterium]
GIRSGWGNITGESNTSLGSYSYMDATPGSHTNCTMIGTYSDCSSSSSANNSTALGYGSKITASDQVRVGDASVTSIGGYAGWTTLTKKGSAKSINEDIVGLEFIKKLRPVSYKLDVELINKGLGIEENPEDSNIKGSISRSENLKRSGFLAEEVEKAAEESGYDFSGLDKPGNKDDQYGIRYSEFVVPLIKAVQEQQDTIEKLEKRIEELEGK